MLLRLSTLAVVSVALAGVMALMAAEAPQPELRAAAAKQFQDGNWNDAYQTYRRLSLSEENAGQSLAEDFTKAVQCLNNLQRQHEVDDLRDEVVELHADDWRLLVAAAQSYRNGPNYGFVVGGEFRRGDQRGGGQYVLSQERDRVQALRLLDQARKLLPEADVTAAQQAEFFDTQASFVLWLRDGHEAWRLQDLTDLSELPDYEEGNRFFGWRGGSTDQGAPVDEEGNPVYHTIPESWENAASDGQRWRWSLEQIAAAVPDRRDEVDYRFAQFLRSQFGVQTMAQWGILLRREEQGEGEADESGPYAVSTLAETETIARLASGIKRFTLPDEFNFIRIYQRLAEDGQRSQAEASLGELAQIFEDRQQYPQAAEQWRQNIRRFRDRNNNKQHRLDQIVGNWGRFEPAKSQPARTGATVDFRFRNGEKVEFTARRIRVDRLLEDVKAYLKSNPRELDWQQLQIDNLGYRLVEENQQKYVGEQVAQWNVDLEPRPEHFDRRITVATPLQQAGAYLLTGQMADGNVSRIILWVSDTAIVKKPMDGRFLYYVADAVTGKPVAGANVEFFGWLQERVPNTQRQYRVSTRNFAERTDDDGQIVSDPKLFPDDHQWLAIARTRDGRFAHLGFNRIWFGRRHHPDFEQRKVIVITDRPVYRPEQTVEFKLWLREASYKLGDEVSQFANTDVHVRISDPQGTKVWEQTLRTDEYGGVVAEYALPAEAKLGVYSIALVDQRRISGGGTFRVEEYKKPEFEVLVEAPDKPVALGETITATIRAKYYFGAPVTNAVVRYKVERSPHETRWFPYRPWDWLYGEGYWWFSPDREWYPGFVRWGCFGPRPFWIPWNPDPPELVLDREVEIGSDGTVEVEIDTELAKALHADQDHKYTITAEVVDASRRTIVGTGDVLVARQPFKVFVWSNRGHYRVGDTIRASFFARTLDGRGVEGQGTLKLLKVTYDDEGQPVEQVAQQWDLDTDADGRAEIDIEASAGGQYRLSYALQAHGQRPVDQDNDDAADPVTIEGGHLLLVRGEDFDGSDFRFNALELIVEKPEYAPGETVNLLINTDRVGSTVLLFVRPEGGIYAGPPQVLRLEGKSTTATIDVAEGDMPNFFVEAVTIAGGEVHTVVQQIVVPPKKRVLNVEVQPDADDYQPGAEANVTLKLTDIDGEPFVGSLVMSVYDRAVEYISGGSNVPEIREYFWKWTRNHHPSSEDNLSRVVGNLLKRGETPMGNLGVFGEIVTELDERLGDVMRRSGRMLKSEMQMEGAPMPMMAPAADAAALGAAPAGEAGGAEMVEPTVRTEFADTAFWKGDITTDQQGLAKVSLTMPENLTDWKIRTWAMGHGTRVGEGETTVTTSKNLLVRLQAPRFFTETDEVVLSAIVHNYLETDKEAQVELLLEGGTLEPTEASVGRQPHDDDDPVNGLTPIARRVIIPAGGEVRVDWRVKAVAEGQAVITMRALTDEESDAMQMTFPVYVHGMLKTESFSGVIRPDGESGTIEVNVPTERRPEESRLEVRFSPTLAGAMVDALPYLASYPYGCTEQTLNRFLPTVITQRILQRMGLDLQAIKQKRTNLNAQQIGDPAERAAQWKRFDHNPVFDEAEVARMVRHGVAELTAMQLSDGGWGWFSGFGERSWPHTSAVVVHGLKLAQDNDVALVPGVLERGVEWLKRHQDEQIELLLEGERREKLSEEQRKDHKQRYKTQASDIDALVFSVLVENERFDEQMQRFLYRDRLKLSLYSQALLGLALDEIGADEQRDMLIRNIDQFIKVDEENQTAYLDLAEERFWWFWYGDAVEANAAYLRLLTRVDPQSEKAAGLVKYLLNNRRHGTYWKSTRDTAYCIESLAEYLVASGEDKPDMTVEVWVDGEKHHETQITAETLFAFDGTFVLQGDAVQTGAHRIELKKRGTGPLYYNAYLSNFTTEDFITAAGLEIKVARQFYRLVQRQDASEVVQGSRGQVIDQAALKYDRVPLANLSEVVSGDLVEVELTIESKNDYEYVVFEDLKAAGCEPVTLQSGYTKGGLGAYVEFRDERVAFFIRQLDRGTHSVSYRLRAEIPGQFSALPSKAYAMYAPELRANSDEMKLRIADRER
jgi:alpha-2-macroglobulin